MMTTLRFEQVPSVDSTNAVLMRREVDIHDDTPVALWALRQTAGRGRRGRVWRSDPEDSITLSVAVHLQVSVGDLLGLPLAVGVCLAQTLESQRARPVALKWPNDLYTRHPGGWAKSGGILTEVRTLSAPASAHRLTPTSLQRVVCGFGLNLFGAIQGLPPSRGEACPPEAIALPRDAPDAVPAGPLYEAAARASLDRRALAHALATAVVGCMQAYPQTGLAAWRAGWQQRDLLAGRRIRVHHADERVLAARAIGIDAQGALEIEDETGRRRAIASGEVSVRLDPQDGDPDDPAPQ